MAASSLPPTARVTARSIFIRYSMNTMTCRRIPGCGAWIRRRAICSNWTIRQAARSIRCSTFTNDPNLVQQFTLTTGSRFNTNYLNNFMEIREDPLNPGTYFGVDSPDFGMHGAGQILTLYGPRGTNAERMFVTYITPKS